MPRQREAPERPGGPASGTMAHEATSTPYPTGRSSAGCRGVVQDVSRGRWKRLMPGQPPWPAHSRRQPADQLGCTTEAGPTNAATKPEDSTMAQSLVNVDIDET